MKLLQSKPIKQILTRNVLDWVHDHVVVVPSSMQLPGWEPVLESCEPITAAGIMARQLRQLRTAVPRQLSADLFSCRAGKDSAWPPATTSATRTFHQWSHRVQLIILFRQINIRSGDGKMSPCSYDYYWLKELKFIQSQFNILKDDFVLNKQTIMKRSKNDRKGFYRQRT